MPGSADSAISATPLKHFSEANHVTFVKHNTKTRIVNSWS